MSYVTIVAASSTAAFGRTIPGVICVPFHHADESEEFNDERVARRIENIASDIARAEGEFRLATIQAAFYISGTARGDRCQNLANRLDTRVMGLHQEYDSTWKLLHDRLAARKSTPGGSPNGNGHLSQPPEDCEPPNNYELSWISRLLTVAGEDSTISTDDLRVALPDRAFRAGSILRVLKLMDFLGLELDIDGPDKFSLRPLLKFALQKPEPTAEQVSAMLHDLLVAQDHLRNLVFASKAALSPTLDLLTELLEWQAAPESLFLLASEVPEDHLRKKLLSCLSPLKRAVATLRHRPGRKHKLRSCTPAQPSTVLINLHATLHFRPTAIESIAKAILRNASEHLIPPEGIPQLLSALSRTEALQKEIYETHLRIVLTTCSSFIGRGVELADLFQEACQGLMNALDHFDPEQEVTFRGYAAFWILQSITRAIANQGRLIRLPVHVLERLAKLPPDTDPLQPQDLQPEANPSQQFVDSVDPQASFLSRLAETQFLNIDDVSDAELSQAVAAEQPVPQFAGEEDDDLRRCEDVIHRVLDTLDPQENDVLARRFGLNGSQPQTLEEIGERYAVTRERIRQIEVKALKALRHPSRSEILLEL